MISTTSINGIYIRLTEERWKHIIFEHPELVTMQLEIIEIVAKPERILQGNAGQLLAVREIKLGKWLIVVYWELGDDGFIATAFFNKRRSYIERKIQVWP